MIPSLFLFLKIVLALPESADCHINFRIRLSAATKYLAGILIGIALTVQNNLGELTSLSCPNL